jgi:hypothetical protein
VWETLTQGLPQENGFVNVLRDAMEINTLHESGIDIGTTGGHAYASPGGGGYWFAIVGDLPRVFSEEV